MTRGKTILVAVIVAAVAILGVVTYAYWGQIATMIGVSPGETYNTTWIELRNGNSAEGTTYQVAQDNAPAEGPNYASPMPANPFSPGIQSRWDCTGCSDDPGDIWLYLGEDAPAGTFNIELFLNYESGTTPTQAEPLLIETIDTAGNVVDSTEVRDTEEGTCSEDNTGWILVTTDCSSGGGNPLALEFKAGGGLRLKATGGSLGIGGVRVSGVVEGGDVQLDVPKSVDPGTISPTGSMNFTFNIKNNGTDPATDVIMYESIVDQGLDGQIDMDESTIGGASLSSLETCSQPDPAGGYCFLDLGGASGVPDTIIAYFPTLEAGANVPVELTLKPKVTLGGGGQQAQGFSEGVYNNAVGITATEVNPGNPAYPPSTIEQLQEGLDGDGVNDWIWVNRTATVNVTGGVTPPAEPDFVLDKTPQSQTSPAGGSAEFSISLGNEGSTATQVFFWDSWVDNDLDGQVESVDFKLAGTETWSSLGTPSGDMYSDCGGTEELAACFLDTDSDNAGDTILVYTNPDGGLGQFALTEFFSLRFNLKNDAIDGTYRNQIGVTSKELNNQDPNYPDSFGIEQWNWVQDDADLVVGSITPPPPVDEPSATLEKQVSKAGVQQPGGTVSYLAGDTVQYTLTLTNNGNTELTNMKVRDYYDTTHLENLAVTEGTSCSGLQPNDHICFDVGSMSEGSSATLKYTARITEDTPNNTTIANNAQCSSDQFPDPDVVYPDPPCNASDEFVVTQGVQPQPQDQANLYVSEFVDKTTANAGDKLTYVTTGGNEGPGDASNIWFLTSLLISNQEVVQQVSEQLDSNTTIEELEESLQQNMQIVQPLSQAEQSELEQVGIVSEMSPLSQNTNYGVSGTSTAVRKYTNLPGDDYVTGLELPVSPTPGTPQKILDLDRDGINDTIIHTENASWAAGFERAVDGIFTNVRGTLNPGTYTVNNTGAVIRVVNSTSVSGTNGTSTGVAEANEVLTDSVATTINIPGNVEPSPTVDVVKVVSDNDETNTTANTSSAGETLSYSISYTNLESTSADIANGPTARQAWIMDDYDERYVDIVDAGGAIDSGNALFWYIGDIAYGETVSRNFTARIKTKIANNGIDFANKARVGALGVAPKEAVVTTSIPALPLEPPAPYVVPQKDMLDTNGGVVEAGDVLQYEVVLQNVGNEAAIEVEARDIMPVTLEQFEVISVSEGVVDQSTNNELVVQVPRLDVEEKAKVVYQAKVNETLQENREIINEAIVGVPKKPDGTTPAGQTSGTTASTVGRVGSAFTGPSSGSAAAARIAGAQTEAATAETGGNTLLIALVTAALALSAGIGVLYLRRQLIATKN